MSDIPAGPGAAAPREQLSIVLYADGRASVGGIPVAVPNGSDLTAVRDAVLRTAVAMAAQRQAPLRAVAFEPDGLSWPLVIHPDGVVEEDLEQGGAPAPGSATLQLMAAVVRRGPRTETLVLNPSWSDVVELPPAPERFCGRLAEIARAGEAGRVEAAMALATDLEHEIVRDHGPSHPNTLNARAVRAHVGTLAHDWPRAAGLYLDVAGAWLDVAGERSIQVRLSAGNAHSCWCRVTDPAEAARIGEAVVRMWRKVPGAQRELAAARHRLDTVTRRTA
ncbi:hypothetical protein ACFV6E_38880 [Streptomyces sp. NPDC059785]|uniref:hypothetical protein n=1 Tax=unclassified Streptomyces TaxID=2593676 RepID=UPI00364CA817